MHIHKGHRNLTLSWENAKKQYNYTQNYKKKSKTQLEGKSRSLIGVLISLRTPPPIFSHGGEGLTMAPCAPGWRRMKL